MQKNVNDNHDYAFGTTLLCERRLDIWRAESGEEVKIENVSN